MLANSSPTEQPTSPRSLVISPNLDALLEHEERVRAHKSELLGPSSPVIPVTVARRDFPAGLPPPPRGSRQPKFLKLPGTDKEKVPEPTSPKLALLSSNCFQTRPVPTGGDPTQDPSGSSSTTNPYINPAPTLVDLLHGKKPFADVEEVANSSFEQAGVSIRSGREVRQSDVLKMGGRYGRESVGIPSPEGADWKVGDDSLEKQPRAASQRSHSRTVSLPVDKQLNSCRNIVGLFWDSVPRPTITAQDGHLKRLFLLHTRASILHTSQLHNKPKVTRPPQPIASGMAYANDENMVLDIRRRHSDDFIDISNNDRAWRRRPLDSHASSSRTSTDSSGSGSTIGPPAAKRDGEFITNSDVDPKIAYLPASRHDRQSFIEFFSPTIAHFPLPSLSSLETEMLISKSSATRTDGSSDPQHFSRPPKPATISKPTLPSPTMNSSSSSGSSTPRQSHFDKRQELPPMANFLDMDDRAGLVRKSRKLARVFGETPRGDIISQQEPARFSAQRRSRGRGGRPNKGATTPRALDSERPQSIQSSGRRYSIPALPGELSESLNQALLQSATYKARLGLPGDPPSNAAGHFAVTQNRQGSRTSFIDLSDEEDVDDAVSAIIFAPNSAGLHRPGSPSLLSLYEAMTPEQRAEEEKRRKREKLAKLHRFLGSRVPADLVLGVDHLALSLPPIQTESMPADDTELSSKLWLRRRRSSSAGDLPSWSDDVDRMKEELNDTEKAINVRRAQKMEKMFGVAPPQTLYHTRHSPSPSVSAAAYTKRSKSPPKPSFGGFIPPGEIPSPTYQQRNPNRSSYIKQKPKRNDRPSTAESSRMLLLEEGEDCYDFNDLPAPTGGLRTSLIYHHYQHSLKSLNDILDRDDRESLAELHQYLNDYEDTHNSPLQREPSLTQDRRLSSTSSIKSERRRSLPARTSMLSIASEISITTPKPEMTDFQLRRRRAAKLTQFFGVNYRDLINDVLESLEHGLEHERKRGTLQAEEVEDLLERLRNIKTKRKGFF